MLAVRLMAAFAVVVLLAGCTVPSTTRITGSGKTVTVDFDFDDFTRVKASSAFTVDITQGESYSIQVEVDDNLEQYLEVTRSGDTLQIGLKPVSGWFGNKTLRAQITMPQLTGLNLSGASNCEITGFSSDKRLDVEASGASSLRGDISGGAAKIEASGASTIELTGSAPDLTAIASGASTLRLDDFAVKDASVEASGASRITVNATGTLNARASGASTVRYVGEPARLNKDASGASTIGRK